MAVWRMAPTKHFARSFLVLFVAIGKFFFSFHLFSWRLCVCVPLENGTQLYTDTDNNNTENNWTATRAQPNGREKKFPTARVNNFCNYLHSFCLMSLVLHIDLFPIPPFSIGLSFSILSFPYFSQFHSSRIFFPIPNDDKTLTRFRYKKFLWHLCDTRFFSFRISFSTLVAVDVIFFIFNSVYSEMCLSFCRLHSLIL